MINTKFLFASLLLSLTLSGCTIGETQGKPNVVIIFIDDMGYADPSCFGNLIVKTPNIDKIAENGLKFTNFYVNSPICSPSRTALTTGKYPMRYRIHSYIAGSKQNQDRAMANFLDPSAPTLARTLQQKGYATGQFGKWHLGGGRDLGNAPFPTEYGYDKSVVCFEGIGNRVLFPGDELSKQSAKLGKGKIIWVPKHKSTGIYVDSALTFIQKNPGKPFFVNLFPNDVHDPHLPDSLILEKYKTITDNPFEQRFFAVLEELDNQVGRFMGKLDELGELDNTIVIFTSDNGPTDWAYYYNPEEYPGNYKGKLYPPGFTGGFYGRKWSLYEGGIRMPFIIQWKGKIPSGATDSTSVVAAFDLFPSICSILGVDIPEGLDGKDKSEALLGHPMEMPEPIMWEYASNPGGSIQPGNAEFRSPNLAIRDGDWKLLINADYSGTQLFNLKADPGEKNNLAEVEKGKVKELADKVIAWRKTMPVEIAVNK
ncbi:Arylsulfatase [hydrothermal vent metagenome]|uniref:Arylsulfatase n=1 Tax=hydrothermal vent metagenome TaxID=652676 RepID=A0A3B0UR79_9ZZZZ